MLQRRASVLICTYEQPRELELALAAICRQSVLPHEVFVGDDGSGVETKNLVQRWVDRAPFPLKHVWQADKGYRKARIMNEAARRASGDQFLFLDGDSFPHHAWVEDHLAAADERSALCGRRVKLGPRLSPTVTVEDIERCAFDTAFSPLLLKSRLKGDTKRWSLGIRLPKGLARILHPRPRKLMGVNFSLPREAFIAVNGFNEAWTVYGHEDRDLELRLLRAGTPTIPLLNRGIVFHLHHEERERTAETQKLIAEMEASTVTRCEIGYDQAELFSAES
jgi:GT2 family glycosyltransferase